jgi:hypothetical protein
MPDQLQDLPQLTSTHFTRESKFMLRFAVALAAISLVASIVGPLLMAWRTSLELKECRVAGGKWSLESGACEFP